MNKKTILLACMSVLCTQAGMVMYVPSLPFLSRALNTNHMEIAYTFIAYVLGYAIAMLSRISIHCLFS